MTNQDHSSPSQAVATPSEISAETLSRCADLLATEEINWPTGLSESQEAALVAEVRRYRRLRLIKFIASRIAADIAREEKAEQARLPHDYHGVSP